MGKKDRIVWKTLVMISQVGISMITPILLGVYIGLKLDGWFSTGYWFIIFLIIGVLAAFRNVYLLTKKFYAKDLEKETKKQQYFDDLRKERERSEASKRDLL